MLQHGDRLLWHGDTSTRDRLVRALAAGRPDDQAREIVDALDAYLEDGPGERVFPLEDLTPDLHAELSQARSERDRAVRIAEQSVRQMQAVLDSLKGEPQVAKAAE